MLTPMIYVCLIRLLLGETEDFDERQLIAQGKASRAAIWAGMLCSLPFILYGSDPDVLSAFPLHYTVMVICCIILITYLTVAIVLDAYVPLNFPGIPYLYLVFGAVGITMFLHSYFNTWAISLLAGWIALAGGIVFLWAGILLLVMKPIRKCLDSKTEA